MDENIFSDTRDDIKLVIIAEEVATLGNSAEQPEQKINKNKTFKSEECVVCLLNPSNVPFCSCGHICICSKCLPNIEKINKTSCVICEVKSEHIRVI